MDERNELSFHYTKSKDFRTVRADGAWGGVTPRLGIFMAVFSERPSIPDRIVHKVENGVLGPAEPHFGETQGGIVRDVEVGIDMDRETALKLIQWLQEKVTAIDNIRQKVGAGE